MALYALKEEYRLRGWDKLPYAVVDTRTGQTVFPPKHVMETLLLCDGTHDLDSLFVPTQTKDDLAALVARGYVRPAAEGETIAREQCYLRYENRFVATAHWALTGRCNYRCRHCYMSALHAKLGELSHDAMMRVVDQIAACGIPAVSLTGGEPLLRKDFFEIVDALRAHGIAVTQQN